ncbi:hypothetical protein [Proteiniborus sp. MB09-C3]|uniref:hypothetical protein n=1 Tax=Proteiniborus sp. MB09-C3 TaxID=3050072 RepID=UPI002552FAE1|nr:hypothetical protein [Proteiniborus sp. MB09-C3]WIV11706.1 hypothetical protein QO263_16630 [Proteiniborus sp. MB09-C3]
MIDHVINYSLKNRKPIDIIYMKGMEITKRKIRVFNISGNLIKAVDIDKGVIRSFKRDSILSAMHTVSFNYNDAKIENHKPKTNNIMQ